MAEYVFQKRENANRIYMPSGNGLVNIKAGGNLTVRMLSAHDPYALIDIMDYLGFSLASSEPPLDYELLQAIAKR